MPPPSADSPITPARRWRPDGFRTSSLPGAPRKSGALFCFLDPLTITSAHNENLKELRKLAGRRWRDKLQRFVAEGEDLLAAADAAGWQPLGGYVAGGSGTDGVPVAPPVPAEVPHRRSG